MNRLIGFIIVFWLLFVSIVQAEIIFETNFNNDLTTFSKEDGACDYGCTPPADMPSGWTNWYTRGIWTKANGFLPSIEITDQVYHGASGNSFRCSNESRFGSSGYGGDGVLTKLLTQDYQEIYYRLYFKSQAGWQYTDYELTKLFRFMHFDRSGSLYLYFSGGDSAPISVFTYKYSATYGVRTNNDTTYRCDPQETDYACDGLSGRGDILWPGASGLVPTSTGMLMDGAWHVVDVHLKMNTYSGGAWNSDGIYELSVDNISHVSRSDVNWKRAGSSEAVGWNTIEIGGNSYNEYAPEKEQQEQWYSIDDVVVSTTPIPLDYVIEGAPTYDSPTIDGPADFSTSGSSVEIEGTYTVDPDLPDQSVIVTWTLGVSSGFAVAALGVFSCTVPVDLGVNSIVFRAVDSNDGEDSGTTVVTRTAPPSGNVIYTGSMSGGTYR